ncbi:FixH family protein [Thalassotalea ponticola]|uniref:FixH family protein n=1 Tax=Thalassotalea ponticola TaxID=1523392 RepID=UPI0025B350D8|nr:FixH family protein [Thalassotalea ponticola]MDN3651221.1 FixH family protein [Thalassotalea ponticola]
MKTPWYKEPWAYLVFILPLSAVVAGITTLIIANTGADTVVVDDYYKKGKAINQDIGKYKLAEKLGVRFDIKVTENELVLKPTGIEKTFPMLNVAFYHATLADRDFAIKVTPDGNGWLRTPLENNIEGKWRIVITPFDNTWKLQTILGLPQQQFRAFELRY